MNLQRFTAAFPRDHEHHGVVDSQELSADIAQTFHVEVPPELQEVWDTVGSGYCGNRLLYLFGDGRAPLPRPSLISWNQEDFWRAIYPPTRDGGPLFFAETCFGEQIGLRWEEDACIPILLVVDTFEAFRLAPDLKSLFEEVLVARDAIDDPERVARTTEKLGPLRAGMHYAPIVSPLVGGTDDPGNFHFETPSVHLRTAVATFKAVGHPQ